jgi:hypothetical protein
MLSGLLINCKSVKTISNTQIIESTENSIILDVKAVNPEYVAVHQLLFRGFPNSNQTNPLISTSEIEIQKQFPTYFKDFFKAIDINLSLLHLLKIKWIT